MTAPRFLADENLAKLARWLRMAGFDAAHRAPAPDDGLLDTALAEDRVIVTRDRKLAEPMRLPPVLRERARRARVHLLEARTTMEQLAEICRAFGLDPLEKAYTRCPRCNVPFEEVAKDAVAARIPERSFEAYDAFRRCPGCDQVFWEGEHVVRSRRLLEVIRARAEATPPS